MLMKPLNLKVIRPNQVAATGTAPLELSSLDLPLRPQLAFDPKIYDLKSFYDYALATAWRYDVWSSKPPVVEEKIDGVRCQFVLTLANSKPTAYALARSGRRLASVVHLIEDLITSRDSANLGDTPLSDWLVNRDSRGYSCLVIDCELFAYSEEITSDSSPYMPFRIINGFANRQQPDDDTRKLRAYVFQCYWTNRVGRVMETVDPALWELLLFSQLRLPKTKWLLAQRYPINRFEDLEPLVNHFTAKHSEGIIFKSSDFRHFDGRTKLWLKLKFRRSGTFELVDVIAGEGKCLGNAGAIKVKDALGNTSLVGTGFTDSDRAELSSLDLSSRRYFVEVSYMTKTGDSLREASFESIRYDLPSNYILTDSFSER